jgi:hypothetical protein
VGWSLALYTTLFRHPLVQHLGDDVGVPAVLTTILTTTQVNVGKHQRTADSSNRLIQADCRTPVNVCERMSSDCGCREVAGSSPVGHPPFAGPIHVLSAPRLVGTVLIIVGVALVQTF